jgi:hypothetical protein
MAPKTNFPRDGTIAPGDILVSNFNNAPTTANPMGLQGTGTTIGEVFVDPRFGEGGPGFPKT